MFTRTKAFTRADRILRAGHLGAMIAFFALYFGTQYILDKPGFFLALAALFLVLLVMSVLIVMALIGAFIICGDLYYSLSFERLSAWQIFRQIAVWLITIGATYLLFLLALDLAAIVKSA